MQEQKTKKHKGFSFIELLVVTAIIGLLSSIILVSTSLVRIRARESQRVQNVEQMQKVLALYYAEHGLYPKTFEPGQTLERRAACDGYINDFIPSIVPSYIGSLPTDPMLNCDGVTHSWVYASNGIDYKLIVHAETSNNPAFMTDPAWDNGPDLCLVDGSYQYHIGSWTNGAKCWVI